MANQPHRQVAGEPLRVLEEAIACLDYEVQECGCITVAGKLPELLGRAMHRALITIELEMIRDGIDPYSGPGTDPLSELLVQVVAARTGS